MYAPNPLAKARIVITSSEQVGAKLPALVLENYHRATSVMERAARLHPGPGALTFALAEALKSGSDPAADAGVQRAYLGERLGDIGISKEFAALIGEDVTDTFTAHAEEIVQAWRKPFDKAATDLAAAHGAIGDLDLEDGVRIMKLGGTIAVDWAKAQNAVQTINRIETGWSALSALAPSYVRETPRRGVLRIAEVEPWTSDYERDTTPWDLVRAGARLSLANGEDYTRRVAAAAAAMDQNVEAA